MTLPSSNYLAVDPGETSGWALLSLTGGVHAGQCPYAVMIENAKATVQSLVMQEVPIMLLCERAYASTKDMKGGALKNLEWEIETIGCLKWITRMFGIRPLKIVSQADSKNFATTELLQELGWWKEGLPHAMDAMRVMARGVSEVDLMYWKPLVRKKGILDGHG